MIENVLHDLGGVGIFGIVSICLFFTFFSGMLVWAARLKKSYLNTMGGLPLDGGESVSGAVSEQNPNLETRHE